KALGVKAAEVCAKPDNDGSTALHLVCHNPSGKLDTEAVKLVLKALGVKAAEVCAKPDNDGSTALHLVCHNPSGKLDTEAVKLVLKALGVKAAEVCAKPDNDGSTALHLVCHNPSGKLDTEAVKLVLQALGAKAAEVCAKPDNDGWTPLHLVCRNQSGKLDTEAVKLVLEALGTKAGEVCAKPFDNTGWTPLHLVCDNESGKLDIEAIKLVLKALGNQASGLLGQKTETDKNPQDLLAFNPNPACKGVNLVTLIDSLARTFLTAEWSAEEDEDESLIVIQKGNLRPSRMRTIDLSIYEHSVSTAKRDLAVFSKSEKNRCPITQKIMAQPVVASDGQTYELEALKKLLSLDEPISPKTGLKLTSRADELIVSDYISQEIKKFIKKHRISAEAVYLPESYRKALLEALDAGDEQAAIDRLTNDERLLSVELRDGMTVYEITVVEGFRTLLTYLLGIRPNYLQDCLFKACKEQDMASLKRLLALKMLNIEERDALGILPVTYAALSQNDFIDKAVEKILEKSMVALKATPSSEETQRLLVIIRDCLTILKSYPFDTKKISKQLCSLLKDKNASIRQNAALALGELKTLGVNEVEALLQALKYPAVLTLNEIEVLEINYKIMSGANDVVYDSVVTSLSKLEDFDADVTKVLLNGLKDEKTDVRRAVVTALGKLPTLSQEIISAIANLLKNPNDKVCDEAAGLVGDLNNLAQQTKNEIITLLKPLLNSQDWLVRCHAAKSLYQLGDAPNEALDTLISALRYEEEAAVRYRACVMLARFINSNPKISNALLNSLRDADSQVQCAAIKALGHLKNPSPDILVEIELLLTHKDAEVRLAAQNALCKLKGSDEHLTASLLVAGQKEAPNIRLEAVEALKLSKHFHEDKVEDLLKALAQGDAQASADLTYWLARLQARLPAKFLQPEENAFLLLMEKRENPAKFLSQLDKKNNLFHIALQQGNERLMNYLLEKISVPDTPVELPLASSYLSQAVELGLTNFVERFLFSSMKIRECIGNPGIEYKNVRGETPLLVAVKNKDDLIVALLLKAGADYLAEDKIGYSALQMMHSPVYGGVFEENLRERLNQDFLMACEEGNKEKAAQLLRYGASINVVNEYGKSGLHIAGQFGRTELVDYLMEHKIDTSLKDCDGATGLEKLLFFQVAAKNLSGVQALIEERGIDISVVNAQNQTVLHLAAKMGWEAGCHYLVEQYADIDAKDNEGKLPF
ncbi:MAG: ankyrin repeat domain-containing protein, partial [Candidatus Berkiella sp.]